MSDDIEFQTEDYQSHGALDETAMTSAEQTGSNSLLNNAPCSNSSCSNKHNPAEEAWVKLVSAIPVSGQASNLKCVAHGTAAPSQDEVQSLVAQIRPSDPDKYALADIAEKWRLFSYDFGENPDTGVAKILRSKLDELANGWQGDDFDGFTDQMDTVFANCEQIIADIGDGTTGMSGMLKQKADEILALQGGDSHELPYPAPQYWVEDEGGLFSNPKVHVRPPFTDGNCQVAEGCMFGDGDTEEAMQLGGFDGEYANELNQYVADQTELHFVQLKHQNPDADETELRNQAAAMAEDDGNKRAAGDYDHASDDYQARAAEQNDTVISRWSDAEISTSEFTPAVEDSKDTTFRHSGDDLDGSHYSPPSGGDYSGSPTSSGTGGLNPPSTSTTFGDGGLHSYTPSDTGLDSNNPWSTYAGEDPDNVSGGLASGGVGGLPGSGLGSGAGSGLGAGGGFGSGPGGLGGGAGLFGPAVGGGAGGAGGGRGGALGGAKAGVAGAGRGAGGKSSSMMGGGRGGHGSGSEENEGRETWLTEDDEVWGIKIDPENDPFE